MTTTNDRAAIVVEAKSWVGTPYHHQGRIKGAGVDCAMLLAEVYNKCGLIPFIDPTPYPADWHLHKDEERYIGWVKQYAHEVDTPLPGDIALYKFGRCVSHGAIVAEWPLVIHAYLDIGCSYADGDQYPLLGRLHKFYSLFRD